MNYNIFKRVSKLLWFVFTKSKTTPLPGCFLLGITPSICCTYCRTYGNFSSGTVVLVDFASQGRLLHGGGSKRAATRVWSGTIQDRHGRCFHDVRHRHLMLLAIRSTSFISPAWTSVPCQTRSENTTVLRLKFRTSCIHVLPPQTADM